MLMDVMLTKLSEVHSSAQVHDELQNAFLELANHQLHPCIDVMLSHPLPYSMYVLFYQLFCFLSLTVFYVDRSGPTISSIFPSLAKFS